MAKKVRNYCFTINNYTEDDIQWGERLFTKEKIKYLCMGREIGESGTPHIQGFIIFNNPRVFNTTVKLHDRWHLEICKGTAKQNEEYCKKDGDFIEFGEAPKQSGKRTDIDEIREAVLDGKGMKDICTIAKSYQAMRYGETLLKYTEKKRNWVTQVYWLWGPTGAGKTQKAFEMCEGEDVWVSGKNLKWWEGYDSQKYVIIDDLRGDFCTYHEMLRILDRYEYRIECKGGSRQLLATHIIITSCYHPEQVWKTVEDKGQLLRRITRIQKMELEQGSAGNTRSADHTLQQSNDIDIRCDEEIIDNDERAEMMNYLDAGPSRLCYTENTLGLDSSEEYWDTVWQCMTSKKREKLMNEFLEDKKREFNMRTTKGKEKVSSS